MVERTAAARRTLASLVSPDSRAATDGSQPLAPDLWSALCSAAVSERVVPALASGIADGRLPDTEEQAEDAAALWLEMMRRCLRIEGRLLWLVGRLAERRKQGQGCMGQCDPSTGDPVCDTYGAPTYTFSCDEYSNMILVVCGQDE